MTFLEELIWEAALATPFGSRPGDLESIFACPGVRLGFLVSAAVQISKCVAVICMGAVALCLSISMETSFKQLVNMIRYGTTA